MKIISILGSPHGEKGNTGRLLKEVLRGSESKGAECEVITLRRDTVRPCLGCDRCHKEGRCPQKDGAEPLIDAMLAADGIILATPNYIFHVSAQLKILLDRCSRLLHCLSLEGKYGVSVVTSGGGDEIPIIAYLQHILTIMGATPVDAIWATMGTSGTKQPLSDACRERAFTVGCNLVKAWEEKWRVAAVEQIREQHRERMRKLINYYAEIWPYEYAYWQGKK